MNEGLSVKEACSEVGMPRSTYYYIIARDTDAIAIFKDMLTANQRERLWMILVNQVNILQRLIDDGPALQRWKRQYGYLFCSLIVVL